MSIESFIDEFFTKPLAEPSKYAPYNAVNTIVFALLAIAAAWGIFKLVRKMGIKFDWEFAKSILPFILLGSATRVAQDAGVLPRSVQIAGITFYPFVTPVIYVLIFLATIAAIFVSLVFFKKHFHKSMRVIGVVLLAAMLLPLLPRFQNFVFLLEILAITAVGTYIIFLLQKATKTKYSNLALFAAGGQMLDGAATFVGIFFAGYSEQHVIGGFLISIHPALFLLVKFVFAFLVAEMLCREKESEERNYVLILIALFGIAPGVRDALRILAGT